MAEAEELENMVLSFRVSELQMLLGFAGRNKSGRKNELQARALELLRLQSHPVQLKIRELYKTIQADQLAAHQMFSQSGGTGGEPPIDQTMHTRNYYTRQGHAQSMSQQQQAQQSVQSSKDLPPAHQASMPQSQVGARGNPVYQTTGYTSVAPQRTASSTPYNPYNYSTKVLPSPIQLQPTQYPVHPDVKLKKLPFFDLLGELLKPSSLMQQAGLRQQENAFVFHLTPQQSTDIASSRDCRQGGKMDYSIQVQMRFCLQETSCEQEDHFPPSVQVKVNGKLCPLPNPIPTNKPGMEPKRPPRPVNISPLVKLSPTVGNHIQVTWSSDYARRYAIAVYIVKKLTSTELLLRLKNRGAKHSDYTRGLIKEKLNEDADSEIATTSLRVSLACPLGKMRMATPCRASTCSHLQCFDASLFLQMNERKPTWNCPVCDKPALYDNLVIDGYFQEVLNSSKLLPDVNEIQLLSDGSWENLVLKKENKDKEKSETKTDVHSQNKIDDTIDLDESNTVPPTPKEKKRAVIIDLISDSDDDDPVAPSAKKQATGTNSPKKTPTSAISSTSESPELMIIDLE